MFQERLNKHLFDDVEQVLLAVSGGADSVAMAHALVGLKRRGMLSCEFVIGHVNHCLRGAESDADEAFVRDLGCLLDVSVVTEAVDVAAYAKAHKLSIETAGRRLRLDALGRMAAAYGCGCIATAHHADDQAETLVHRLMRGTGFRGLCGIRPRSAVAVAVYVRPMLKIRRAEIIQYCSDNKIQWRQDKSNTDLRFTRNRIRHQLLPHLKGSGTFNSVSMDTAHLTDSLLKLSASAQNLQRRVDGAVKELMSEVSVQEQAGRIRFDRDRLNACCRLTFYEIIRQSVVMLGAGLRDYSQSHFEMIRQMISQSRARADFPGGIEIVVEGHTLVIQHKGGGSCKPAEYEPVKLRPRVDGPVGFGSWTISCRCFKAQGADVDQFLRTKDAFVEWFDADKVVGPIIIRSRQAGDRFWPIGSQSAKKVARFLQDGQFDGDIRQNAFVMADAEKILWVAPIRMCELAKTTSKTTQIIEISIIKPDFH